MPKKTVSILGCGWLGLPLAEKLVQIGFSVKGSTTSTDKLTSLESKGISPFHIDVSTELKGENIPSFFQSDILFLNIPFKRRLKDPNYYKKQIDAVAGELFTSPINFVIFSSSTSVYPNDFNDAKEDADFVPPTRRAEVLLEIEQALLKQSKFDATVIRFAGLYGASRHLGRFLSKQKINRNGKSLVNLIHLDDCIEIVLRIIEQDVRSEIFNACTDLHPSRQSLYSAAAQMLGEKPPGFDHTAEKAIKIVNNQKIKEKLKYTFKHPDPMKIYS